MPKKDKSKIPKGLYCYDKKVCPYWKSIEGRPEQEDGWCDYLGKGDYEINREERDIQVTEYIDGKEDKYIVHCNEDNPCSLSLLWDQCKECGINDDIDIEDFEELG